MRRSVRIEALLLAASLLLLTTAGCGQAGQPSAGAAQKETPSARKGNANPAAPASEHSRQSNDDSTPTIEQATAELKKINAKINVDEKDPQKTVNRIRLQDPNAVNDKMF